MEESNFLKVKSVLNEQLADVICGKEILENSKLADLGINSMSFIKLVVGLEDKFDIEFDDDDLDVTRFKTVGDVAGYITDFQSKK